MIQVVASYEDLNFQNGTSLIILKWCLKMKGINNRQKKVVTPKKEYRKNKTKVQKKLKSLKRK